MLKLSAALTQCNNAEVMIHSEIILRSFPVVVENPLCDMLPSNTEYTFLPFVVLSSFLLKDDHFGSPAVLNDCSLYSDNLFAKAEVHTLT